MLLEEFPEDEEMDEFTHSQRQALIPTYQEMSDYYYNEILDTEKKLRDLIETYDVVRNYIEDFLEREAEYEKNRAGD